MFNTFIIFYLTASFISFILIRLITHYGFVKSTILGLTCSPALIVTTLASAIDFLADILLSTGLILGGEDKDSFTESVTKKILRDLVGKNMGDESETKEKDDKDLH